MVHRARRRVAPVARQEEVVAAPRQVAGETALARRRGPVCFWRHKRRLIHACDAQMGRQNGRGMERQNGRDITRLRGIVEQNGAAGGA